MVEYILEELLKHKDIDISVQAAVLVSDGFPLHSVWRIKLEQVIK